MLGYAPLLLERLSRGTADATQAPSTAGAP